MRLSASLTALVVSSLTVANSASAQDDRPDRQLSPEHRREVRALQPKIDKAIDKGVRWLLSQQQRDGSWSAYRHHFAGGQTALAAYTLMKCGVPPEHPAILRAIEHLRWQEPERVYAMGAQMLALGETRGTAHLDRMQDITNVLLDLQKGSWDYPNRDGAITGHHKVRDLSITQFALLGFRAAKKAGIKLPKKALLSAFDDVLNYQLKARPGPDGKELAGFTYYRKATGKASGSMTTAGIASLHIAATLLGDNLGRSRRKRLKEATEHGRNWLTAHFSIEENPTKGKSWLLYYLYGMERVGAFLQTEYFGAHPWYLEGAKFLTGKQAANGSWYSNNYDCDTCFALLFLKRATQPTTGGGSKKAKLVVDTDAGINEAKGKAPGNTAPGDVGLAATGGNDGSPMRFWLTRILQHRADADPKTVAGPPTFITKVEYLVDGAVVADQRAGSLASAWPKDAFFAQHRFHQRGLFTVQARVYTASGPAPDAAPGPTLLSEPFKLRLEHVLEPWMLEAAGAAPSRNLMVRTSARVTATSVKGKFTADRAVDRDEYSDWRFTHEDKQPSLTIVLSKRLRADRIVIHQAEGRLAYRGHLDRIRKLSVSLGKDDPIIVDVVGDELAPIVLPLAKRRKIKRMTITILKRDRGSSQPGVGGISEVALQIAP